MAKLNLSNILGQYQSTTQANANNALIETALENTLSRDGSTPNTMSADLDMNSNDINNTNTLRANQLILAGEQLIAGDTSLVSVTQSETQSLTDGQVAVTFTNETINGSFYLNSDSADSGRLLQDTDFTINHTTKTMTLTESYPSGTQIVMVYFEGNTGPTQEAVVIYDTVALMKLSTPAAGSIVKTKGYYNTGDSGDAQYLIQTAAEYAATPDEYGDHTLANSNIAVLQVSGAVNVKQFGAKLDGATSDLTVLQAMQDYFTTDGAVLYFPDGVCFINGTLTGKSNVSMRGNGRDTVTILGDSSLTANNRLVTYTDASNFFIEGITFDADNATATGGGDATESSIRFLRCSDFRFEKNKVDKYVKIGVIADSCSDFYIGNNLIDRDVAVNYTSHAINISSNFSGSIRGTIENNVCQNNGSIYWGRWLNILNNQFFGYKYGAGVATATNSGIYLSQNYQIIGNVCADGVGIDDDGFEVRGIENLAPFSSIVGNHCYNNAGNGIDNFGKHCIISENECYNNGQEGTVGAAYQSGIRSMKSATIAAQRGSNCIISNNRCFDTLGTGGGGTQKYGYSEGGSAGDLTEIVLSGNNFLGNDTAEVDLVSLRPSYDARTLEFSAAWDPASTVAGGYVTLGVTAPGAEFGDFVEVSFSESILFQTMTGFVSAANVVTVVLANTTTTTRDVASGTVYVRVRKNWIANP